MALELTGNPQSLPDIILTDEEYSRIIEPDLQIKTVTATTYTVLLDDRDKLILFTSASAIAVTVPPSLPLAFACALGQRAAGRITVAGGAGVHIRNPFSQYKSGGLYSTITILHEGGDEINLSGETGA